MSVENAIIDVSAALGVPATNLIRLINFESSFRPLSRNASSGARGLIQFMPKTAVSMGYKSADELVAKYPDVESQLRGPVLSYLSQFKPFGNPFPQSLYLSVFYPEYRYSALDTAFSDTVQRQNPGIKYVGDYVAKVDKKNTKIVFVSKYSVITFFIPVATAALAVIYLNIRRRTYEREGRGFKA